MKHNATIRFFLLTVALTAVLISLPMAVHAQAGNDLEDYVDVAEFSQYVREAFFTRNEDFDDVSMGIDISQYHIPATTALKEQTQRAVLFAIPELATISGHQVEENGSELGYLRVVLNVSAHKNNSYFYAIQRTAAPLLEGVVGNENLSEAEKALILHDRLVLWTTYDTENYLNDTVEGITHTAYGALINRLTVCSGYAQAYQYLLACAGIYSEICSSYEMNHAWNIVYIDGVPYHVDVTWDDPDDGGSVNHRNFLRSTEGIMGTGHFPPVLFDPPQDTRYDYAYWKEVTTSFQLVNGKLYYINSTDGYIHEKSNGVSTPIYNLSDSNTQLNSVGDKLLISFGPSIWLLDPETGEESPVGKFSCPDENKLYEGFVYEKSHLVGIYSSGTYTEGTYDEYQSKVFFILPCESGWRNDPYGTTYVDSNGLLTCNAWRKDSTGWRYLGSDGYVVFEQWQEDSTYRYYLDETGYIATEQWAWDSQGWRWLDSTGHSIKNCWHQDQFGLYYIDHNGFRVRETWRHDGIGWRYLGANGRSHTGWLVLGEDYYYLEEDGYMFTGWRQFGDGWIFFDASGIMPKNEWFRDATGKWCYANQSGVAVSGCWVRTDGNSYTPYASPVGDSTDTYRYYYIGEDCYMYTGWRQVAGSWYYFGDSGCRVVSSWVRDSSGWCYLNAAGCMLYNTWLYDDGAQLTLYSYSSADLQGGKLYHINDRGYMSVGWEKIDGWWYWFDDSGIKAKNCWIRDSAGWCYLGNAGNVLINCWVEDTQGKCYLDSNGRMAENTWVKYNNSWYYVDADGHQCTGWIQVGGQWYFLNSYGVMMSDCWVFKTESGLKVLGGNTKSDRSKYPSYYLGEDGTMATGWEKIDDQWFWFDKDGVMAKDSWKLDSVGWCRLSKDGSMLTNCWQQDSKGTCYIGENGYILENQWLQLRGSWYYLDAEGYRVSGWRRIGGNWYYFYSTGMMATNTSMSGGWINADGIWNAY